VNSFTDLFNINCTRGFFIVTENSITDNNRKKENIMVFMDYENIHNILIKTYNNIISSNFFGKFRDFCEKECFNILDIFVYANFDEEDLLESMHQTRLQQYNVETRHTMNKNKNYADIQIAVDILEQVYNNELLDGIMIISSDKDMIPIVKAIKRKNKKVYLMTTRFDCDLGISIFPDRHFLIENIIKEEKENVEVIETTIVDEVYNNINSFIEMEYSKNSNYPDFEFDYAVRSTMSRVKIFRYDVLSALLQLEQENKIYIYEYTYNEKKYKGVVSDKYKDEYIKSRKINESDIIENFVKEEDVKKTYDKYIKK